MSRRPLGPAWGLWLCVVLLAADSQAQSSTAKLGVGTSTPLKRMHVKQTEDSAVSSQLLLQNEGANAHTAGMSFQVSSSAETTGFAPKAGILFERIGTNGRGVLNFYNSDSNTTNPFAAADERMRINSLGNVGIGTTTPNAKLDIFQSGSLNATTPGTGRYGLHLTPQNATVDTAVGITFGAGDTASGTTAQSGIYSQFSGSYGTKLYFAATNSYFEGAKTRLMIDHNGNVGIGTTSPTQPLSIIGRGYFSGGLSANTNSTAGTGLTVGGSSVFLGFMEIQQGASFVEVST